MIDPSLVEWLCPDLGKALINQGFPELADRLNETLEYALGAGRQCVKELEEVLNPYIAMKMLKWAAEPRGPPTSVRVKLVLLAICNCADRLKKALERKGK